MPEPIQPQPYDEHNQALERHVRPPDWRNPEPRGSYHLVVIGAGTAGLVAAAGAAGLGARVALVERALMGGDCLNVGCVPSKSLIAAARVASVVASADEFGVRVDSPPRVDFPAVMRRMRRLRAEISPHDSAERFRNLGVDVYFGQARFTSSNTVDVEGHSLPFRKALIATGARAAAPPIAGLDRVDYLTNESIFSLTELPPRLGVIGAGPIGCELAQAFALFGSKVVLVETEHGVLPREDLEAAEVAREALEHDGVRLLCCGRELTLDPDGGATRLSVVSHGRRHEEHVDRLLVAVGRSPNVRDLGLETVGVDFDEQRGVHVDDRLRTTNPNLFAAGDVCSKFRFTHAADFMARVAVQNALFAGLPFLGSAKASRLIIPSTIYTLPEIAQIGLREHEAVEQGIALDVYKQEMSANDRAVLDGHPVGFVKAIVRRGTDRLLGATIVSARAGEMLSPLSVAMTNRLGLRAVGRSIHPYPTEAEAIRRLGDQFNRARLTPLARRLIGAWLRWTS